MAHGSLANAPLGTHSAALTGSVRLKAAILALLLQQKQAPWSLINEENYGANIAALSGSTPSAGLLRLSATWS